MTVETRDLPPSREELVMRDKVDKIGLSKGIALDPESIGTIADIATHVERQLSEEKAKPRALFLLRDQIVSTVIGSIIEVLAPRTGPNRELKP